MSIKTGTASRVWGLGFRVCLFSGRSFHGFWGFLERGIRIAGRLFDGDSKSRGFGLQGVSFSNVFGGRCFGSVGLGFSAVFWVSFRLWIRGSLVLGCIWVVVAGVSLGKGSFT